MNSQLPPLPIISFDKNITSDLDALNSTELKIIAVKLIGLIQSGELRGRRLEKRSSTGNLEKCFKVYFDLNKDALPRFRIVYAFIPNLSYPRVLRVLAVAERENLEAYKLALQRLQDPSMSRLLEEYEEN
jgi:hypothetical protein